MDIDNLPEGWPCGLGWCTSLRMFGFRRISTRCPLSWTGSRDRAVRTVVIVSLRRPRHLLSHGLVGTGCHTPNNSAGPRRRNLERRVGAIHVPVRCTACGTTRDRLGPSVRSRRCGDHRAERAIRPDRAGRCAAVGSVRQHPACLAFSGQPGSRPRAYAHPWHHQQDAGWCAQFRRCRTCGRGLVAGRVLVAHNAVFDWGFLQAESLRCVAELDSSHRLCTLALARRLDLDVRDFKLGTLAAWANIRQLQAHSAVDDVRVLESIFRKLMVQAIRGQVTLPMSANTAAVRQPYGERAPSISSPWEPAGAWTDGTPLVQGMKFVITGGTRAPRGELYAHRHQGRPDTDEQCQHQASFLVCNDPNLLTRKASRAAELATPGHRGAVPGPCSERFGRGCRSGRPTWWSDHQPRRRRRAR